MRAHGTTAGTRFKQASELVIVAAVALAAGVVTIPVIEGISSAGASATLLPAAGKVHIKALEGVPSQPGPNFHPFASSAGKVIPASWPRTAALVRAKSQPQPDIAGTSASANWAGYEDVAAGAQFTEVSADWTVPAVQTGTYGDSSTWVGIDGTTTPDLIQAGTDQSWSPSGAVYYAWYELLPGSSVQLGVVSPGDEISAMVSKVQGGLWEISVADITQHTVWDQTLAYSAPATSAEWILEAPTIASSNSIESLADFGTVQFSNLAVAGTGTASALATPVYMVNTSSQIIAYPTVYSPSTDSFAVIYGSTSTPPSGTTGATIPAPTTSTSSTTTTTVAPTTSTTAPPASVHGYFLAAGDGGIFAFGAAQFRGSTGKMRLTAPITGMAATADHGGYWLVGADGSVFAFGDAHYVGSIPAMGIGPAGSKQRPHLAAPIVGISSSANGNGYLLVARDGGVFAFGNARFAGSCASGAGCPAPVVTLVPDVTGKGYWLLLTNCEMLAFGDAPKIPDTDCQGYAHTDKVVATSAVRTPDGHGYWVLLANGTVFPEGDAKTLGSWHASKATPGSDPAVAITPTSDGHGAWVITANGGVETFGDAPALGNMAGKTLSAPITAASGW
ncbi:MAG TPA: G1 family glutamic endopeptidase [Acidimicrobiales bacterium]|nr:G1 family glutamic endopeptidase [Acidimicrobiales bacterium]